MALTPDQYQRGAILESDGANYDVRGAIQADGGGRFLIIGTLGQPQAGLVSEDVVRDNEGDQYTPLDEDDAHRARQDAYNKWQHRNDPPPEPEPTPGTAPDTGGTEGTAPGATPDQTPTDPSMTTTPEPGGTPDSTAPAGPGAPGGEQTTPTPET